MRYKCLPTIIALFTASLLTCDTIGVKIFAIWGFNLTSGMLLFPLTFLFGDILTEVYGYAVARRVIWSAFGALLLMVSFYQIAIALPPAGFWHDQSAFETIFSRVPRIVLGSVTAYLCGEFLNSYVVARMKVWTKGRYMGARFVASTIVGQLVDTILFVTIAFGGVFAVPVLLNIIFASWVVKVAWEILALPLSIPLVRWLKRVESEDYFDNNTNFNPFKG